MFSKLVGKVNFPETKFEEMPMLKSKKVQIIFRETFILALLSAAVLGYNFE